MNRGVNIWREEINKKVSKVYKTDTKRIDRKMKELDKKINERFKNI